MAVRVRLTARGAPARMAGACFPIAQTPIRATGGLSSRVTAVYGTQPVPMSGPPTSRPIPDGPTSCHSAAVRFLCQTWSVVRPALPRRLPWAGEIPHGVPGETYTVVGANPPQDAVVRPAVRVRTGANQARVTTNPKPTFRWKRQGVAGA